MTRKLREGSHISIKDLFIILILIVNAFAWLSISPTIIDGIMEGVNLLDMQEVIVWSAYYGSIVISSIIGSILASKIDRLKFIYAWIAIGIVISVIPIFYTSFTWIDCLAISILLGFAFGLGLPSCLSYFADITRVENRGRISGIILLFVYIASPLLALAVSELDLQTNLLVFAGWRSLSIVVLFLQSKEKNLQLERKSDVSFQGIIKDKAFGFYILAWIMFCLVDSIGGPMVIKTLGDLSDIIMFTNPILVGITALIAGIAADWFGRKRIVLYGFISLGVAYALIGIAPGDPLVGYFFIVINGITMGLLFAAFIFILWGDISQSGYREKYYAIGEIPFFLTYILGLILNEYLLDFQETQTRIFSIAAFFLFLAVLPLLYAPETLPEKKMELMRLRKFAEDAKKTKEKYEKKMKI